MAKVDGAVVLRHIVAGASGCLNVLPLLVALYGGGYGGDVLLATSPELYCAVQPASWFPSLAPWSKVQTGNGSNRRDAARIREVKSLALKPRTRHSRPEKCRLYLSPLQDSTGFVLKKPLSVNV